MMSVENCEEHLTTKIQDLSTLSDFDGLALLSLSQDTNAETVLKILVEYRKTVQECRDRIHQALDASQTETVMRACHKLIGTSELLGFKVLATRAREIEQNLKNEENLQKEMNHILRLIEKLDQMLTVL